MRFVSLVALCLLAAPELDAQTGEAPKTIEIALPTSKQAAFSQTMAAFVDAGLVVTAADDAGVIRAGPFPIASDGTLVTYWANVIGDVNRARVVLRATITDPRMSNALMTVGVALTSTEADKRPQVWNAVERVESKLRAAFPSQKNR